MRVDVQRGGHLRFAADEHRGHRIEAGVDFLRLLGDALRKLFGGIPHASFASEGGDVGDAVAHRRACRRQKARECEHAQRRSARQGLREEPAHVELQVANVKSHGQMGPDHCQRQDEEHGQANGGDGHGGAAAVRGPRFRLLRGFFAQAVYRVVGRLGGLGAESFHGGVHVARHQRCGGDGV